MTFNVNYAPFDVDKFLRGALHADQPAVWDPACNTYEDEQGYWVQIALPGLDRKDISIVFEDGVLTVKGGFPKGRSIDDTNPETGRDETAADSRRITISRPWP